MLISITQKQNGIQVPRLLVSCKEKMKISTSSIANVANSMPELKFELLDSNWPKEVKKPSNVKSWTIRDSSG